MSGTKRLEDVLEAAKIENELDRKHWIGVRDQYRALDALLERLPDKRVHQAMIPLSKVAFCPGRLVHTNEILGSVFISYESFTFNIRIIYLVSSPW